MNDDLSLVICYLNMNDELQRFGIKIIHGMNHEVIGGDAWKYFAEPDVSVCYKSMIPDYIASNLKCILEVYKIDDVIIAVEGNNATTKEASDPWVDTMLVVIKSKDDVRKLAGLTNVHVDDLTTKIRTKEVNTDYKDSSVYVLLTTSGKYLDASMDNPSNRELTDIEKGMFDN